MVNSFYIYDGKYRCFPRDRQTLQVVFGNDYYCFIFIYSLPDSHCAGTLTARTVYYIGNCRVIVVESHSENDDT